MGDTQCGALWSGMDLGGDSLSVDDRMYAEMVMVMQPQTTVDIYEGEVIVNGEMQDT